MQFFTFQIAITLKAPFFTQGLLPPVFGIDSALLRDENGHPLLPGTLLTGKIRQAASQLQALRPQEFGALLHVLGSAQDRPLDNDRRLWVMGDLTHTPAANTAKAGLNARTRIALDKDTGTVKVGALQIVEEIADSGADLDFTGQGYGFAADAQAAQNLLNASCAALRWVGQLGALAGSGFGQVQTVKLQLNNMASAAPQRLGEHTTLCLSLTPLTPMCVDIQRQRDNQLVSGNAVPGGAIKGALAQAMLLLSDSDSRLGVDEQHCPRWPLLARHLDKIRIRHAVYGASSQERPSALPLSLALLEAKTFVCLGQHPTPMIARRKDTGTYTSPSFQPDWKKTPDELKKAPYQKAPPEKRTRVRTAIDSEKGRASDGQLFSVVEVLPQSDHHWHSAIDLHGVPSDERTGVIEQLQDLLQQLQGHLPLLGKTKALARLQLALPTATESVGPTQGLHLVCLQSPAALVDVDASSTAKQLHTALGQYFATHSQGSLRYSHHYSRQRLAGGHYLSARFAQHKPWLLFEAGSTFALAAAPGQEAQAQATLTHWLQHGLPSHSGNDWRQNPYRPQEGHGEVRINPPTPSSDLCNFELLPLLDTTGATA